jgi:hypothetical protein
MNKQSCENSIVVLKKVRDVCSSQLDDGVLSELDRVIKELEEARHCGWNAVEASRLALQALQMISVVVRILTNIDDWMK